ncbi:MAG: tetratricopeptide repeat protein [Verrucomicrobiota bacterium]
MGLLRIFGLIVGFILLIKAIQVLVIWWRLLALRFRKPVVRLIAREETPQELAPLFAEGEKAMSRLGFTWSHALYLEDIIANRPKPEISHVYYHAETGTFAAVAPPEVASGRNAFHVAFLTYFADGEAVVTINGIMHAMLPNPPRFKFYDHYVATLDEQWAKHQPAAAEAVSHGDRLAFSPEQQAEQEGRYRLETLEHLIARGWLVPDAGAERWRLRVVSALVLAVQLLSRTQKQALAAKKKGGQPLQPCADDAAVVAANVAAFEQFVESERRTRQTRLAKAVLLLVSAVLFCLVFGLMNNWFMLPALLGVLFFHELGHLFGMKLFGYRDRQMLFMPFLGAAAIGTKEDATPVQKLIVYLLGPVPGILVGVACLFLSPRVGSMALAEVGMMAIFINYLNLLPVVPLDGGRIVESLFLSRFPRAQFLLALASTAVLGLAYVGTHDRVFFFLAVLFGLALPSKWQWGSAVRLVKKILPPGADARERLRAIFFILIRPPFAKQPAPARIQMAKTLVSHFASVQPRLGTMLVGGLVYFSILLAPFGLLVGSIVAVSGVEGLRMTFSSKYREQRVAQLRAEPDWQVQLAKSAAPADRWQVWMNAAQWNLFRGRFEKAGEYADQALEEAKAFDASDPRHVQTLVRRAEAAGSPAQSYVYYTQALARAEQTASTNRAPTAEILERMGQLEGTPLTVEDRIRLLEKALVIRQETASSAPLGGLGPLYILARIYEKGGRLEEAEKALQDAVAVSKAGGGEHPYAVSTAMDLLAEFYVRRGQTREAEKVLTDLMARCNASTNKGALWLVSSTQTRLGWMFMDQKDYASARKWFDKAVQDSEAQDQPAMLKAAMAIPQMLDLCYADVQRGDAASAQADFQKAQKMAKATRFGDQDFLKNYAEGIRSGQPEEIEDAGVETNSWNIRRLQAHADLIEQFGK